VALGKKFCKAFSCAFVAVPAQEGVAELKRLSITNVVLVQNTILPNLLVTEVDAVPHVAVTLAVQVGLVKK